MLSILGAAGIVLGFAGALGGILTVGAGLRTRQPRLLEQSAGFVALVAGGVLLAVGVMEWALLTDDFSIRFVAEHHSRRTPFPYDVATLWSALEGSILLWALVLVGYLVVTRLKFRDRTSDPLVGWALLTMFAVCVFFFGLMLPGIGPADPFQSFDPAPGFDGPGPNALLQNHVLMAFHPPMLYLGYVGFTVPFAFAIAALVTGRLGEGWLLETRRWTLFAWGFLTTGIVLGAWWSYEVLGWGGAWGWDPVENASLLPWLTGTAYLHSVMVQERRGMLRVWNILLLCATFSLTILGTFLTRSGVLESVHAFTESGIGPWLLSFFAVTVLVSVGLIGWRGDRLRAPGRIDSPLSREGAFLFNNLLFAAFAFAVLLGTVWPLIVEAVNGDRLSVGRPWFDFFGTVLGLALLLSMAVAPVLPWRKAKVETLARRLHWPAWTGTGCAVLAVALGADGVATVACFGLGGFAAGSALRQVALASRRQGWRGVVGRTNGGMVVHLGVVLLIVGYVASTSFQTVRDVRLSPGEEATVAGHTVRYLGSESDQTDQRIRVAALVSIDGGQAYAPSLRQFPGTSQAIGTPSVKTGPIEDVYLTLLTAPDDSGAVNLRVIIEPLAIWMWIGGAVMVVGTALAAYPGRRRDPLDPVSAPIPTGDSATRARATARETVATTDEERPQGEPVGAAD